MSARLSASWLIVGALLFGACDDEDAHETPELVARKADCRALMTHIFEISHEAPRAVPPEDIDTCAAADPKVIACMHVANDLAGVRGCIPATK